MARLIADDSLWLRALLNPFPPQQKEVNGGVLVLGIMLGMRYLHHYNTHQPQRGAWIPVFAMLMSLPGEGAPALTFLKVK